MLILAILVFGFLVGGLAQLILGHGFNDIDWPTAFWTGLAGSFVGGLLIGLIVDGDLGLHPAGLIGSVIGAIIVALGWGAYKKRS